jgi:hypothetical protein
MRMLQGRIDSIKILTRDGSSQGIHLVKMRVGQVVIDRHLQEIVTPFLSLLRKPRLHFRALHQAEQLLIALRELFSQQLILSDRILFLGPSNWPVEARRLMAVGSRRYELVVGQRATVPPFNLALARNEIRRHVLFGAVYTQRVAEDLTLGLGHQLMDRNIAVSLIRRHGRLLIRLFAGCSVFRACDGLRCAQSDRRRSRVQT